MKEICLIYNLSAEKIAEEWMVFSAATINLNPKSLEDFKIKVNLKFMSMYIVIYIQALTLIEILLIEGKCDSYFE